MAKNLKSIITVLLVLLFLNSTLFVANAHHLNVEKLHKSVDKAMGSIIDELYVEAIETGGPSSGGNGHGFTNAQILGIKTSGPSPPGEGH